MEVREDEDDVLRMKNYPESIEFLGECGRFQLVVFFLLCATIIPNGYGTFSMIFINDVPAHRCLVPDSNLTQEWRQSIIPVEVVNGKEEPSRCSRFRLDLVRNLSAQGLIPGRDVDLVDLEQEGCVDGWSYSTDVYQSTIVSEYDLVCDEQWKRPFTSTVFFMGVLFGSFFSGQLSDKFGRKPVLFATIAVQMIFTLIQVFSTSWTMFTVLLFVNGLGQTSNFVAALVLGAEILTGNMRVLYSSLGSCMGFAIGYITLPLCAYYLRDWKSLLLAQALPILAYIPLWWFIPESPLWLLSLGRVDEAEAIVTKAARWNKVQPPSRIFEDYTVKKASTPRERHSVLDLLRTSSIRVTTLALCLVMFTVCTGYLALAFSTAQLHANPYMSGFISAAVEVPAYVSSWLALRYLPRRLTVIGTLLLEAAPLFLIQLVPLESPNLKLALEMIGKYSITVASSLMFAYMAELYPTLLRNTGTGVCTTVGKTGNCFAPFLLTLNTYMYNLPYIVIGSMSVVSAFIALLLPESFGHPLPETLQQMQKRRRMKCLCSADKVDPGVSPVLDVPL